MIKISIIIPCYNASERIKEALDSILNQTLKEIEIICVDDGSTDHTIEILSQYTEENQCIKVVRQKNQYAGTARNKGMSIASGKYLYFMDADDVLEINALEKVFNKIDEDDADVCLFGAGTLDLKTGKRVDSYPLRNHMLPQKIPFSHVDLSDKLLVAHHIAPWNRLYRKSFIDKIGLQFQTTKRSNDLFFCVASLFQAQKITVFDEILYIRTTNSETSLVETMDEDPYSFYHANKKLREFFIEKGVYENFKKRIIKAYLDSAAHVLSKLKSIDVFREVILFLKDIYFVELEIWENKDLVPQNHRHFRNLTYIMETPRKELEAAVFNKHSQLVENKIRISIIIPCYNAERFLGECLDSLLAQTLQAFEIIAVDDGSTDRTVEMLKGYARKDARISFLKQKNQYAGVARNHGLEKAKGKYLLFLDADDFFEPGMLETMYNKCEEDVADICIAAGGKYDLRTGKVMQSYKMNYHMMPQKTPFSGLDVAKHIFNVGYSPPWNKLYKKSFINKNNLRYQGIPRSNDVFFTQSAMAVAERITIADGWLFNYRVGSETSLVETMDKNPLCFYDSYGAVERFLIERGIYDQVKESFKKSALASGLYALNMTKTKEGWLKIALFLKERFIPELGLTEAREFLLENSRHAQEMDFLLNSTGEYLNTYQPVLRESGVMDDDENKTLIDDLSFMQDSKSQKPNVSIVVTNLQSPYYVRQSLSSIVNQTLKNIEIICVYDEAVEGVADILGDFRSVDHRIKVVLKGEKLESDAKNEAIRIATGEYIMFVDGHDLLMMVSAENLYRKARTDDVDDLLFNGITFYENITLYHSYKRRAAYLYKGEYSGQTNGKELMKELILANSLRTQIYTRMFKLAFLRENNLLFRTDDPEGHIFTTESLLLAVKAQVYKEPLYLKRISSELLESNNHNFSEIYNIYCLFQEIKSLIISAFSDSEHLVEDIDVILSKSIMDLVKISQETEKFIPVDYLKGSNKFLNQNKLNTHLQKAYLLFILKSFKLEQKPEEWHNEKVFSDWLTLVKELLVYIDDDIIQQAKINNYNKNLLLTFKETGVIQPYLKLYTTRINEDKKDISFVNSKGRAIKKLSEISVIIDVFEQFDQQVKIHATLSEYFLNLKKYDLYFENAKKEKIMLNIEPSKVNEIKMLGVVVGTDYLLSCDLPVNFLNEKVYLIIRSKDNETIAKKVRLKFKSDLSLLSSKVDASHLMIDNKAMYYRNSEKSLVIVNDEQEINQLKVLFDMSSHKKTISEWKETEIREFLYPYLQQEYKNKTINLFMDSIDNENVSAERFIKHFEKNKFKNTENYLIIHKGSKVSQRLKKQGLKVVEYKSLMHFKLLLVASHIITPALNKKKLNPFREDFGGLIDLFHFKVIYFKDSWSEQSMDRLVRKTASIVNKNLLIRIKDKVKRIFGR